MEDNEPAPVKLDDQSDRTVIVGIGASAGGLEAIREMLASAQGDTNLAFVVVQHLDPNHESLLAELLGRHTDMKVRQVAGGEEITRGHVYIIPPGHGLSVEGGVLNLTDFAQPRGLRRPIDDFFESLAEDQGRYAACVILSGTGADGSAGLRAIKEHGGLCIVQAPETAKYDGMPTSAQSTGLVDFVRSPDRIIESIQQFYAYTSVAESEEKLARTVEQCVEDICTVVRKTSGHDFFGYKKSTLIRRIQRRIQVLDLKDATAYLRRIRSDADECDVLFRELLINVTRFFRDPDHFDVLRDEVVRPLVRDADDGEIRIWIPGCSSGEEAYSIAMLFAEEVRSADRHLDVQIFATDIDERMLRIAREGVYPHAALADIPETMRDRYTIARESSFQVATSIREMIRFSIHSVVRDPPFSNIDMLSCRNLLIYFGDKLQTAALPIFHYALKSRGVLFLGPSETVGRHENLFQPIDAHARIFRRKDGRRKYPLHLPGQVRGDSADREPSSRSGQASEGERQSYQRSDVTEKLMQGYAPASLLVSPTGQVLGSTGKLGKYLDINPGRPENQHAHAIARPGLREGMSALIRNVVRTGRRAVSRDLTARSELGVQKLDLVADPMPDGSVLLVFRDRDRFEAQDEDDIEQLDPSDSHVQSLEDELRSTRTRLHTTVEELETANEELKSSNEEMMSMNEELQSTNEELATVNDELKSKVDELSVANADLSNFFASTTLPLVVVDNQKRIRNFTDAIQSIYPFRQADRGRPLSEVTGSLVENEEVLEGITTVMRTNEPVQMRVSERSDERTWALVITPYLTRYGDLDGATLVFTELTDALRLQDQLSRERERLKLALEVAHFGVWEFVPRTGALDYDSKSKELLGARADNPPDTVRKLLRLVAKEDRVAVESAMRNMREHGEPMDVNFAIGDGDRPHTLRCVGSRVGQGRRARILGVLFDVTKETEARRVREMMIREMNHRVKNLFSIISGMVRIAGRNAQSIPALVEGIERRVTALSRSHDMTQRSAEDGPVTLEDSVRVALEPYDSEAKITCEGPNIEVTTHDQTPLSLLLHEWATNAAKYGVLGPLKGRLDVMWHRRSDGKIDLHWNEIYDERLEKVETGEPGFGSTLVTLSASQIRGEVSVDSHASGRKTRLTYEPER
nr:chemotaxis protein CheB [Pelagovum pacificum]